MLAKLSYLHLDSKDMKSNGHDHQINGELQILTMDHENGEEH